MLANFCKSCKLGQHASDGPLKAESSGSIPDGATNQINQLRDIHFNVLGVW